MSNSETHVALARAFALSEPDHAARLVESSTKDVTGLLDDLGVEASAAVMAEIAPPVGARALEPLAPDFLASILSALTPQRAAQLLRCMPADKIAGVTPALAEATRQQITSLLEFEESQAGSRVDPRAPIARVDDTVGDCLALVRRAPQGALNYVYIVKGDSLLTGVISMRELLGAPADTPVATLMAKEPYRVIATDSLHSLIGHPGWTRAHALPVVTASGQFLGVIRYSTYREIEKDYGEASPVPAGEATSAALMDLFSVGTSAMGQLAGTLLLGRRDQQRRKR